MKSKSLLLSIVAMFVAMCSNAQEKGAFTDSRDGKVYKTVVIGKQTWMAENLGFYTAKGSWCYNDSIKYCTKFGRLYDWETAKTICPAGWHIPSDAEWTTLTTFLGGGVEASAKLKSTSGWIDGASATNTSGFTALPGGYREGHGVYNGMGYNGYLWCATNAWGRDVVGDLCPTHRGQGDRGTGFYVRCVKD